MLTCFARIYFPLEKFPLSSKLDIKCALFNSEKCANGSEGESENGSTLEDVNVFFDSLAKLSATLQGNTVPL